MTSAGAGGYIPPARRVAAAPAAADVRPVPLAVGLMPSVPDAPVTALSIRITLQPGQSCSEPDGDPGTALTAVQAGAVTVSLTRAFDVYRATQPDASGAPTTERVVANTETTLAAGDWLVAPIGSGGAFANAGTEAVVLLAAGLRPGWNFPLATPVAAS